MECLLIEPELIEHYALLAHADKEAPHRRATECRPVQFGAFGAPAGLAGAALLLQPAHCLPACFGQIAIPVHAGPACHTLIIACHWLLSTLPQR